MRKRHLPVWCLVALCLLPMRLPGETQDPRAVAIAESTMEAMGGLEALARLKLLRFDFVVTRDGEEVASYQHWWDRGSGRYRLEGKNREGQLFRVLLDLSTRDGSVWVGADRLEGQDAEPYLERAWGRYINDTYWLLMPWKMLDPGVHLSYEGEVVIDGRLCDKVGLGFDSGVGLTPGDRYWVWVDRDSGLLSRWAYVLQEEDGSPGSKDPTVWLWQDWEESAEGLLFARTRIKDGEGDVSITFPVLRASSKANEAALKPILRPASALAPPSKASGISPREAGVKEVLVVLNKSDHTAALVHPETLEVLRLIPTGIAPHEAVVSRDGQTLYVANYGAATPGNSITVVDIPAGQVKGMIDLGDLKRPHGLALGPDGSVWATVEDNQAVVRLGPGKPLTPTRVYPTGQKVTHMLALTPDGGRVFTANMYSDTVTVLDTETGEARHLATGAGPEGIDVSSDGAEVWIAHRKDNNVVILDTQTLETLATLETAAFPIRVKFTPDGSRVLVSCAHSDQVSVFDRASRKEIRRIDLGAVPIGIQITPDGRRAFVANTQADQVSVIDLTQLEVEAVLKAGREPDGLAWASF